MSISAETARIQYTITSLGQTLSVPFYFLANDDLKVVKTDASTFADTTLTLTTHYTVANAGNPAGGSITLTSAAAVVGEIVTIYRNDALTQPASYPSTGQFPSATTEQSQDRLTMLIQQLRIEMDRCLRVPISNAAVSAMTRALRSSALVAFDANGTVDLTNSPTSLVAAAVALAKVQATPAGTYQDYNVKTFGAVGDGVTNDSAAIQAAIDYVAALGGGTIRFPVGDYLCVGLSLKQGVQLVGGLQSAGYVTGTANLNCVRFVASAAGTIIDTPVGATYSVGVAGINFSGLGSGTACKGIRLRNVTFGSFKNLFFDNFSDQTIYNDAGLACEFLNIRAQNCLLNRVQASATGVIHTLGTDHYFDRCELTSSCSREGTKTSAGNCHGWYLAGANHFLSNCIGEISDSGFYIAGSGLHRLSNCRGDLNYMHGFDFASGRCQMANCLALSNSQDTTNTYSGFHVQATVAQGNIFTNCQATSLTAKVHKYGFEDLAEFASIVSRSSYDNCMSATHATAAFSVVVTNAIGSAARFAPHSLQSTATGTIDQSVEQAEIILLNQSGATTIQSFTGGVSGQSVFLLGNANVTIKHNSSIKTSTGADKTLAADKIYHFKLVGVVWREVTN